MPFVKIWIQPPCLVLSQPLRQLFFDVAGFLQRSCGRPNLIILSVVKSAIRRLGICAPTGIGAEQCIWIAAKSKLERIFPLPKGLDIRTPTDAAYNFDEFRRIAVIALETRLCVA